jgi:hypothetical protein
LCWAEAQRYKNKTKAKKTKQRQNSKSQRRLQSAMSSANTAVQEYDAIARAIQHYIDGGRTGKSTEMKKAFHAGATIYGYIGADLFGGPIQGLYDWNDQNGPAAEMQVRIASVDVAGSIATARLEIDNWTGHRFTDMFTLLKTGGEWKIISKVFYLHP